MDPWISIYRAMICLESARKQTSPNLAEALVAQAHTLLIEAVSIHEARIRRKQAIDRNEQIDEKVELGWLKSI